MIDFRAAVYILENAKAQRVKVGVTTNNVVHRLISANQVWLGRKATCQICGARFKGRTRFKILGRVPEHGSVLDPCPGGNALPLEQEIALAESHLEKMKTLLGDLSGSEKGSAARRIQTLAKRIELYRHYQRRVGWWDFSSAFYTDRAGEVELLTHEILAERLDKEAPFGEVFCCSVSEATEAVETALGQLGLLESARKETQLRYPGQFVDEHDKG